MLEKGQRTRHHKREEALSGGENAQWQPERVRLRTELHWKLVTWSFGKEFGSKIFVSFAVTGKRTDSRRRNIVSARGKKWPKTKENIVFSEWSESSGWNGVGVDVFGKADSGRNETPDHVAEW